MRGRTLPKVVTEMAMHVLAYNLTRVEFHLAAIVQNLKTMALRLRGPPTDGVCASLA